jgi:hypothetical protein
MLENRSWAERWKPAAGLRAHLFAAALLWTAVGTGLSAAGIVWCFSARKPWIPLGFGIGVGALKGIFIIAKIAARNARRIVSRGDGKCLGGFLSVKTWLLVAAMMGSGMVLRRSSLPRPVLGVIYTAVGTGLLTGCLALWKARAAVPKEARPAAGSPE